MTDLDTGADLHALMDRALTDLPTPVERLHEGAVRRGRPLRRRRRAGAAFASVAVVAALAAVAAPFVGGSGPTSTGVAVEPPPQTKVPPFPSHPGWWDMPVGEMRDRLLALLPDDVEITAYERVNTDHAPGESNKFAGVFNGTLRDKTDIGPGSVSIMLTELPQDPVARAEIRAQHFRCNDGDFEFVDLEGQATCETSDVHGGQANQRMVTFTDQGVTYTEVRRWTGDGEIYAAVANSTERKWGPPASALRPPLNVPELIKVAESASWVTE